MDIDKYTYELQVRNEMLHLVNSMLGDSIARMHSMKYDDVLKKEKE